MAPISEKIKFVTQDPYPKAKELKGKDPTEPLLTGPRSESSGDVYLPNSASSGRDPQIMDMQRAARESGRTSNIGNRGKGDPTGMPKDWRHTIDSNGTSMYRDRVRDESAYRPETTVRRKRKRNALPPAKTETKTKKSEPPRKKPTQGWKPETIPKYRLIPKKAAPPPAKATGGKGSPARPTPKARELPKGAGDFMEARANSNAMHQLADQAVDKNGAFSPSALMMRTGAVFYDMSGALPAQKVGEAWGDPNGSVKDRVLSTGELGLAATQYLPVVKVVGEGVRATKNGVAILRSGKRGLFKNLTKSKPSQTSVSGRKVDTGGLRGEKPLTEAQKLEIKGFAEELGMPGDRIKFTSGNTGYVDDWDTLMVGTDVMPAAKPSGTGTLQANQRLSWKAAVSHEIDGHRAAGLTGKSHAPGSALDEAQASIRAARYGKGLTQKERTQLLRDAISRLHKEGIKIRDVRDLLWIKE